MHLPYQLSLCVRYNGCYDHFNTSKMMVTNDGHSAVSKKSLVQKSTAFLDSYFFSSFFYHHLQLGRRQKRRLEMLSTIMCTATMAASAAVAESTAQAAAGVATGFTSATSSSSCSLNGVLSKGGTCRCDAPWSGPSCGQLVVKPVDQGKNPGAAIYGTRTFY